MSRKNRHNKNPWGKVAHAPTVPSEPAASAGEAVDLSPVSPAQLAANRANAQLSTGPRSAAGLEKSSKNAVKTALTGRTVLLPSDDVQEYAAFIEGFQHDLKPIGTAESELVQIIADCHWRLRRIQTLEYALYAHGHEQFADTFQDSPQEERYSKILLQTHLTYEKQLRNFHIQEARLDRKRSNAMTELLLLQDQRAAASKEPAEESDADPFPSEKDFFDALDAGYIPPSIRAHLMAGKSDSENGFVFSDSETAIPAVTTEDEEVAA